MSPSALPEALFARTLSFLIELTAISSQSGDRDGLRRAADLLAAALAARGFTSGIQDQNQENQEPGTLHQEPGTSGSLPVLIARGRDVSRSHLLLLGHLDTVLAAHPPHLQDGRLVATGAIDMKGGLATLIGALDLLAERGETPAEDLLLVAVPDEEVGGELSRRAVRTWGKGARAVWVLEPGEPAGDGEETLVAGRRGLFTWHLTVRGRSAHSGLAYWQGRSALIAAARWCAAAEALSTQGSGPTVNCARLAAGDDAFVDQTDLEPGLLGSDRRLNIVADHALVDGEARFLRLDEGEALAGRLADLARQTAEATGTEMEFSADPAIPPVDPDGPHRSLADQAVDLAGRQGWRLRIDRERGGISFPNFLLDPGSIPVLDGLGPVGDGMHTRGEFVDLESLRRRIVLLADLLAADAASRRERF